MKKLLLSALFCSSVSLQADVFVDFTSNVKVVFETKEVVNSAGETVTAVQATASVTETDENGVITAKRQTYVQVEDGSGGQETIVTQEATVATVDPVSGSYDVQTTTEVLTTPVDETGTATGDTTTETSVVDEEDVDQGDLDLPVSTTFIEIDPELETPVVISAE